MRRVPLPVARTFDDADENADLRVAPDETTANVLEFYARARAAADEVIDELAVDELGSAWYGHRSRADRRKHR